MINTYDPDPVWNDWLKNEARQLAECERQPPFRFDSPLFQVHWLMCQVPEDALPLDEFLALYGDADDMVEFVTSDPQVGDERLFDVGCVSTLSVRRIA